MTTSNGWLPPSNPTHPLFNELSHISPNGSQASVFPNKCGCSAELTSAKPISMELTSTEPSLREATSVEPISAVKTSAEKTSAELISGELILLELY